MDSENSKLYKLKQSRLYKGEFNEFKSDVVITEPNKAKGEFGFVHFGIIRANQQKIAIKEAKQDLEIEEIEQELHNLDKIKDSCPYIIACIGVYAWIPDKVINDRPQVHIIFPQAESDIYEICKTGKQFSEREVAKMLEHVLLGLKFLINQIGIIHRDIKPQNILKMENGTYCITDFGISKIIDIQQKNSHIATAKLKTKKIQAITEFYAAPEVKKLFNQQDDENKLAQFDAVNIVKGDIFSLGLTCLRVLFYQQNINLEGMNDDQGQIRREAWLSKINNKYLSEPLKGMLNQNPIDRYGIEESIQCLCENLSVLQLSEGYVKKAIFGQKVCPQCGLDQQNIEEQINDYLTMIDERDEEIKYYKSKVQSQNAEIDNLKKEISRLQQNDKLSQKYEDIGVQNDQLKLNIQSLEKEVAKVPFLEQQIEKLQLANKKFIDAEAVELQQKNNFFIAQQDLKTVKVDSYNNYVQNFMEPNEKVDANSPINSQPRDKYDKLEQSSQSQMQKAGVIIHPTTIINVQSLFNKQITSSVIENNQRPTTASATNKTVDGCSLQLQGLPNIGNTSNLNATLQILRHIVAFRDYLKNQNKQLINIFKSLYDATDKKIFQEQSNCLQKLDAYLSKHMPSYIKGAQSDPEDLFSFFLNEFCTQQDDQNQNKEKLNYFKENDFIRDDWEQQIKNLKYSDLVDAFRGLQIIEYTCKKCHKPNPDAYEINHFFTFNVDCNTKSLQDALEKIEQASGIENEQCSRCKEKGQFKCQPIFYRLPRYLIIVVQNSDSQQIISESLNLKEKGGAIKNYRLHSVVLHCGSKNLGQYQSVIQSASQQKWFEFNDQSCRETSPPNFSAARLIIYTLNSQI